MTTATAIVLDPAKHRPAPLYVRRLVDKIGQPQGVIAAALGLDPRTFRRYLQEPETKGATPVPYAIQKLLELLASGEAEIK